MTGMDRRPYITVALDFFDHPRTLSVSEAAQMHVLRLWGYCSRYLTDGRVPAAMLRSRGEEVAAELLEAGWVEDRGDDGYWCHDYLRHQPSREQVNERVKAKAARQAAGGRLGAHKTWHVNKGRHDPSCEYCGPVPEQDPMG